MTLIGRVVYTTSGGSLRKGIVVDHQVGTATMLEIFTLLISGQREPVYGSLVHLDKQAAINACENEMIYWRNMQDQLIKENKRCDR